MFHNPLFSWPGIHNHPNVRPDTRPMPAYPRNPWDRQPSIMWASQMPPLQGHITNDPEPDEDSGFWDGVRDVGGAILGGIGTAAATMLGGLGSSSAWGAPTTPDHELETWGSDVPLQVAPPPQKLGAFHPTPFAQTAITRRANVKTQQMDMRQQRAKRLKKLEARAQSSRLNAVGRVLADNNTYNPVQKKSQQQGNLFNDVVSGSLLAGVPYMTNAFVPTSPQSSMYDRSRLRLADFQAQQAAKKQAEAQYKQQEQMQAEQRELLAQAMAMVPRQQIRKPREKSPLQQQFERGEPFTSKSDWLQFAHEKRLEYYQILRAYGQQAADQFEQSIKEHAIQNIIGPHAILHKDGYIIVGNQAVGTAEAEQKAREFVEHVVEHEAYPPLQYPTNPNLPKSAYPDVTEKVNGIINNMARYAKITARDEGHGQVLQLFKENFPNNRSFDLQVNYDLPGQVVLGDSVKLDENGRVITVDQYAVFRGKVVKAGYISNFAYGYTAASGGILLPELYGGPFYVGDKQGDYFQDLNFHDDIAVGEGYFSDR